MSHFYGVVRGAGKTAATRRGHKSTGLTVTAASWQGAIQVELYQHTDGTDRARVRFVPWQGAGNSGLLYDGPVSGASPIINLK